MGFTTARPVSVVSRVAGQCRFLCGAASRFAGRVELINRRPYRLPRGHFAALQVTEIDIPGYGPSASACSDCQGMFLCPRDVPTVRLVCRQAVFRYEPFSCHWVNQSEIGLSMRTFYRTPNDRSVTKVSLSLRCPTEIQFCTCFRSTSNKSATRSHV